MLPSYLLQAAVHPRSVYPSQSALLQQTAQEDRLPSHHFQSYAQPHGYSDAPLQPDLCHPYCPGRNQFFPAVHDILQHAWHDSPVHQYLHFSQPRSAPLEFQVSVPVHLHELFHHSPAPHPSYSVQAPSEFQAP